MVLSRLVKKVIRKYVISRRGKRKIHTLEIGGHVQMAKTDPEAQRESSLSDCTCLENEYGSFNIETLKILMHFREPGSSFYFYSYSHTFFLFLIHTYIYILFFFLSHHFFFLNKMFCLLPFEL
jgi:hypothetical protein